MLTVTGNGLCGGKVGYSSKKSAEVEVLRLDDINIHAYKCGECKKWHVGHETSDDDGNLVEHSPGHANRAAAHLAAMEKAAGKVASRIELPRLDIKTITIRIVGDSPLICHQWSKKAKEEMLAKQMGKASVGKENKDPDKDYQESLYVLEPPKRGGAFEDSRFGFPAIAFKNAAVTACTSMGKSITKVAARQAFHVVGSFVTLTSPDNPRVLARPRSREDMVRIGQGTADIRFRGEFLEWACDLTIRYNARLLTAEQIINMINTAGFAVGVGEWRSEKDGSNGLFHVAGAPHD